MPKVRLIDANAAANKIMREAENHADDLNMIGIALMIGIAKMLRDENDFPTIEAEPVRHGRWIECDYKHLEHGFMETEPNAGLCCSNCRTAFQKKKMTYKQYCAACGARMDGGADNG